MTIILAYLNQFIRSASAEIKRTKRNQKRRNREKVAILKAEQKKQEIRDASETVKEYNEYIINLISLHKDCSNKYNWEKIRNEKEPSKPINYHRKEQIARKKLENFKPGLVTKLFNSENKRLYKLNEKIKKSIEEDKESYNIKIKKYEKDHSHWKRMQKILKGVKLGNPKYYQEAMSIIKPFEKIELLNKNLEINFVKNGAEIDYEVKGSDIIPDFVVSQTSTGKLSKKNLPKSKFYALYQDHICSSAIRIAREIAAVLPLNIVVINCISELLNTTTGHLEDSPILSVFIPIQTLNKINLLNIDPSDSMSNFVCNMKFSKTKGFAPIEKLDIKNYKTN